MTTQDNTRKQEQTSTTGTSHGCISGNGREPMGEELELTNSLAQTRRYTWQV